MDTVLMKRKTYLLIFLAALFCPLLLMTANLTYDECWSVINFSGLGLWQIFTDLSLPNNHPLNTLFLHLTVPFSGNVLLLRSFSLICGAFIPVLCGELAFRWSKNNRFCALICAAVLAVLSMPLAAYSGVARGYVPQVFFLLLTLLAMTFDEKTVQKAAVLMTAGAVGVILCVPSGALFLLPAGIGFLIYAPEKMRKSREMWIAAGVIAVFCGIFYGMNFTALRSGQSWGVKIDSWQSFGTFLMPVATELILSAALVGVLPCLYKEHKRWYAVFLALLPLFLAYFSNGGPARCYIYLAALIAVGGGIGLSRMFSRKRAYFAVAVAVLLGGLSFAGQLSRWRFVDYPAVFERHLQELPSGMAAIYRASAGYPVRCVNNERSLHGFQYPFLSGNIREMAVFEAQDSEINGLDFRGGEAVMPLAANGRKSEYSGMKCRVYKLTAVDRFEVGKSYLLTFAGGGKLPEELSGSGEVLFLNPWLFLNGRVAVFNCRKAVTIQPGICHIRQIGELE